MLSFLFELDLFGFVSVGLMFLTIFYLLLELFYQRFKNFYLTHSFKVSDLDYTNELLKDVRRYVRK